MDIWETLYCYLFVFTQRTSEGALYILAASS